MIQCCSDLSKLTESYVFQFNQPDSEPILIKLEADSYKVKIIKTVDKSVLYNFYFLIFRSRHIESREKGSTKLRFSRSGKEGKEQRQNRGGPSGSHGVSSLTWN